MIVEEILAVDVWNYGLFRDGYCSKNWLEGWM